MLVQGPDELPGIHGGTPSEANHHVRAEPLARFDAVSDRFHVGVGLDFIEYCDLEPLALHDILDSSRMTQRHHRLVRYNQSSLEPFTVRVGFGHVAECVLQAVSVEIDLGRIVEPLRVLFPRRDRGDVQQVHRAYVRRNRTPGLSSDAKGEGRLNVKVESGSNGCQGRGDVVKDATGRNLESISLDPLLLASVNTGSVSDSTKLRQSP
mmetsp:Transcript_28506/g.55474  ORF Transcript_28506/g.55474 Transcript_28506/m.55474 type:complete len:208 (-) Transcript_28506:1093-1716(-)